MNAPVDHATIDLDTIVARTPLDAPEAFSAATLERVELRDGRRFVLKHLPAEGDWLTRSADGIGRARRLWEDGVFARIGRVVDHAVAAVVVHEGHDVVVMLDVADHLLPAGEPVSRETSRELLAGLAALHNVWDGEALNGFCGVGARYSLGSPAAHADGSLPGSHVLRQLIVDGWPVFLAAVPTPVADAVTAVHEDPGLVDRAMAGRPRSVLHGDTKLENLGLGPNGLVAIDWGELTGFGPLEVDVAWYAFMATRRVDCSPDELFDDYRLAGGFLDDETLGVAAIGTLAQFGWALPLDSEGDHFAPWISLALTALASL